jgi:lipopolysaccharide export system ATP-binding protein
LFDRVSHHLPSARIQEAVEVCRLEELMSLTTRKLSGGERRRVELGVAVARNPTVLLADEPFLGVMPKDRQFILDVFQMMTDRGAGVLVTGHEIETLLDLADDVIWMTSGTTHHLGSPEEAVEHDQFRREYLGPQRGSGLARS